MYYYSYNKYLRDKFGAKVRRISLNAGFPCPNRDGTLSTEGCIFCNEYAFTQEPSRGNVSLSAQIELAIKKARENNGAEKFVAYFQNGTGTNAPLKELKAKYDTIKKYPEIVSLAISTRPDCVDDEKINLIAGYRDKYDVWIEYGVQTIHNKTLDIINRKHTFKESRRAIIKTAKSGINVGVHVIFGLPGETKSEIIQTAKTLSSLPINGIKFHVLQVVKETPLESLYRGGRLQLLERGAYVGLICDFLENLRPDCVILRLVSDSDEKHLIAPKWPNDKLAVIGEVEKEFEARGTRQGTRVS